MKKRLFYFFSILLLLLVAGVTASSEKANTGTNISPVSTIIAYDSDGGSVQENGKTAVSDASEKNTVTGLFSGRTSRSAVDEILNGVIDDLTGGGFSDDGLSDLEDAFDISKAQTSFLAYGRDYSGILLDSNDGYVYSFSASSRGVYQYTLAHGEYSSLGGWLVTLYYEYYLNGCDGEKGYRIINQEIAKNDEDVHKSVRVGVLPGNYRLAVTPYNGICAEEFTVNVSFEQTTEYEIEYNNTQTRYTELYANVPIKGSSSYYLNESDVDWYMLRVYTKGVVDVAFEQKASDDARICRRIVMTDSEGREIFSSNIAFANSVFKSGNTGLKPGIYYIAVYSRVYSPVEYTLTVKRTTNNKYESENNDSFALACDIVSGEMIYGQTASRQGAPDRDYYKFTAGSNGIMTVSFGHDKMDFDKDRNGWNVSVLNESGKVFYSMTCPYSVTEYAFPVTGLSAGTYYILVDCDNCHRVSVDYSLLMTFTEKADYETEINNTPADADTLTENIPVGGNITVYDGDYDTDYYSVTLTESRDVNFEFSYPAASTSGSVFRITLYDSLGRPCLVKTTDGDVTEVLCGGKEKKKTFCASLETGVYFLEITTADYYCAYNYNILFY